MLDISGFGTGIRIIAVESFPMGFSLSKFADDTDPISAKDVEPIGYEMLFDGSLFSFDKAAPIEVAVSLIPGSDDDINCKILLQNKKGGKRLLPLPDITTMIITYPDRGRVILTSGTIIKGPLVDGILSTGRRKSNTYTFVFGSFAGAQSAREIAAGVIQNLLG